jgi:hypothetical protein
VSVQAASMCKQISAYQYQQFLSEIYIISASVASRYKKFKVYQYHKQLLHV